MSSPRVRLRRSRIRCTERTGPEQLAPPLLHSGDLFSCHAEAVADISIFSLAPQFAIDDRGGPVSRVEIFQDDALRVPETPGLALETSGEVSVKRPNEVSIAIPSNERGVNCNFQQ
jgi:hypothetical protein